MYSSDWQMMKIISSSHTNSDLANCLWPCKRSCRPGERPQWFGCCQSSNMWLNCGVGRGLRRWVYLSRAFKEWTHWHLNTKTSRNWFTKSAFWDRLALWSSCSLKLVRNRNFGNEDRFALESFISFLWKHKRLLTTFFSTYAVVLPESCKHTWWSYPLTTESMVSTAGWEGAAGSKMTKRVTAGENLKKWCKHSEL